MSNQNSRKADTFGSDEMLHIFIDSKLWMGVMVGVQMQCLDMITILKRQIIAHDSILYRETQTGRDCE